MGVSTNLDAVKAELKQFGEKASAQIAKRATGRTAARVRTQLRRMAPKSSGRMRRSIRVKTRKNKRTGLFSSEVRLTTNQFYYTVVKGFRKSHMRKGTRIKASTITSDGGMDLFDRYVRIYGGGAVQLMAKHAREEMIKEAGRTFARTARAAKRRVR